jgi:hypothetical protein
VRAGFWGIMDGPCLGIIPVSGCFWSVPSWWAQLIQGLCGDGSAWAHVKESNGIGISVVLSCQGRSHNVKMLKTASQSFDFYLSSPACNNQPQETRPIQNTSFGKCLRYIEIRDVHFVTVKDKRRRRVVSLSYCSGWVVGLCLYRERCHLKQVLRPCFCGLQSRWSLQTIKTNLPTVLNVKW